MNKINGTSSVMNIYEKMVYPSLFSHMLDDEGRSKLMEEFRKAEEEAALKQQEEEAAANAKPWKNFTQGI